MRNQTQVGQVRGVTEGGVITGGAVMAGAVGVTQVMGSPWAWASNVAAAGDSVAWQAVSPLAQSMVFGVGCALAGAVLALAVGAAITRLTGGEVDHG